MYISAVIIFRRIPLWPWRCVTSSSACYLPIVISLLVGLFSSVLFPQHHALAAGNTVTIEIIGAGRPPGFLPSLVTIHMNDSINFINQSQPPQTYTIAANDGGFFSEPIAPGAQWKVALMKTGTYEYHAVGVALQMVGTILVAPTSVALLPTPDPGAIATEVANIRAAQRSPGEPSTPTSVFSQQVIIVLTIVIVILAGLVVSSAFFWRIRRSSK